MSGAYQIPGSNTMSTALTQVRSFFIHLIHRTVAYDAYSFEEEQTKNIPGCLVDKPWDWDIQQNREAVNHNMQRILSNVGLDVVQTMRSHGVFGPVPFDS